MKTDFSRDSKELSFGLHKCVYNSVAVENILPRSHSFLNLGGCAASAEFLSMGFSSRWSPPF